MIKLYWEIEQTQTNRWNGFSIVIFISTSASHSSQSVSNYVEDKEVESFYLHITKRNLFTSWAYIIVALFHIRDSKKSKISDFAETSPRGVIWPPESENHIHFAW